MQENFHLFVLAYIIFAILIVLLKKNEFLLTIILSICFIITINVYDIDFFLAFPLAMIFCIVEYCCTRNNVWTYNYTNFYIPSWLFFAWALSVVFVIKIYQLYLKNNNVRFKKLINQIQTNK